MSAEKKFIKRGAGIPRPISQDTQAKIPSVPPRATLDRAGIRIAVGIPLERNCSDMAFVNFWNIARRGWPLIERLYGRTDVNRNTFAKALLQSKATHLVMLDLDHAHPPDIVERLARWVLQDRTRQVVGGLNFRRGEPYDPCAFIMGEDGELHAPADWPQGLIEVDAIGHGALLVSREVFERLEPPYWAYSYAHVDREIYPSEDMYFSWLCKEAGIKLWCDTMTTSPHLITGVIDESVFRSWLADNPDKIKNVSKASEKEEAAS